MIKTMAINFSMEMSEDAHWMVSDDSVKDCIFHMINNKKLISFHFSTLYIFGKFPQKFLHISYDNSKNASDEDNLKVYELERVANEI